MAGANAKRVAAQNAQTIKQVRLGTYVSNAIYIFSLGAFKSGRSWGRLFYFTMTDIIAIVLWQQLESMASKNEDLNATGLVSYFFDVIYVTWFVHVTSALISTRFWYFYLSIPIYALYRLVSFGLPYIWPKNTSSAISTPGKKSSRTSKASNEDATTGGTPISKRQEKMKKRAEKGDLRVQQVQKEVKK